jgi:hypothetical protein
VLDNGFEIFDRFIIGFFVLAAGSAQTDRVCEIRCLNGSPMEIATGVPKPWLGKPNRYSIHIVGLVRRWGDSARGLGSIGGGFAVYIFR